MHILGAKLNYGMSSVCTLCFRFLLHVKSCVIVNRGELVQTHTSGTLDAERITWAAFVARFTALSAFFSVFLTVLSAPAPGALGLAFLRLSRPEPMPLWYL